MLIQQFLVEYDLRIKLTNTHYPQPLCDHNEFVMDTWQHEGLSLTSMQKLKACRMMWLQVSRLSEITLANGSCLHPKPLKGRSPHGHHETNLQWPRQDRPSPKWWSLWRQCLRRSFSIDGKDTKLRQPLGEWHASALPTTSFATHAAFVLTGTTNTLHQRATGSSTFDTFPSEDNVIHQRLTRANTFAPLSNGSVDTLPPGAIPVPCTTL